MSKHTGVSMGGSIVYTRSREPKGNVCSKCKNYNRGYCSKFKIYISDIFSGRLCKKFKDRTNTSKKS